MDQIRSQGAYFSALGLALPATRVAIFQRHEWNQLVVVRRQTPVRVSGTVTKRTVAFRKPGMAVSLPLIKSAVIPYVVIADGRLLAEVHVRRYDRL